MPLRGQGKMENCINQKCKKFKTLYVFNCPGGTEIMKFCKDYKYLPDIPETKAEQGDNRMNETIKRAQLNIEIKYVKERIEYHRHTINQLQIMGMGLTDQLNKLEKDIAAEDREKS